MGIVMIRCPTSGQPISTGIETDTDSFTRFPDVASNANCSSCGLQHMWWKREAWIAETPPPEPSPELPGAG